MLQCHDQRMGQDSCGVHVLLYAGLGRRNGHYSFTFFMLSWAFDLALAYLSYRHSAEIDWSSVDGVTSLVLQGVVYGEVQNWVDAVVP